MAVALLAAAAGCYLLVLMHAELSERPQERRFGASPTEAVLRVYVEPLSLDAANDALQIRISVAGGGTRPDLTATLPDRDLVLMIAHGETTDRIEVRANQAVPSETLVVDLNDGSVNDYPLDTYASMIRLRCIDKGASPDTATLCPVQVTAWEGLLGFHVGVRTVPASRLGEVLLDFSIRRTGAFVFFALAGYGAMVVLALGTLTVGVLVFAGLRKIEVTMMGALGAAIFALPALRNALPGGPPLGVRADLLVFLWTELAAVIAFALFVSAWAHRGPRP